MLAPVIRRYLSEKHRDIFKLKNLLLKRGNREKTNTILQVLYALLKGFRRDGKPRKRKLHRPLDIINNSIYDIKPGFKLKRTIVAGTQYKLPIPISPNRATYCACSSLKKAAIANKKVSTSIPELLFDEIYSIFDKKSIACKDLKTEIAVALDQRPFSRYLKKRRKKQVITIATKEMVKLKRASLERRGKVRLRRNTAFMHYLQTKSKPIKNKRNKLIVGLKKNKMLKKQRKAQRALKPRLPRNKQNLTKKNLKDVKNIKKNLKDVKDIKKNGQQYKNKGKI